MKRLKIALIFGNKPEFNIYAFKYFLLSVNQLQKSYEFFFPETQGNHIKEEENEAETCIQILNGVIDNEVVKADYTISIIRSSIKHDYFAWPDKRCAVITTNHWEKYFAPPSLFEYLLNTIYYCLFCSGIKVSGKETMEPISDSITETHFDTIGCIFDFVYDKYDNRLGIALGYICDFHKKGLISYYGSEYVNESIFIIERKWIGNLDEKNTIAYNLKHNFNFNIYKDSGFKKTLWDLIRDKFFEIPGSLIFEMLKWILLALLAAIFIKYGLLVK